MAAKNEATAQNRPPANYSKSDVGRLLRGTFYSFSSFVLVKLIMAVNSIVVARMLTPNDLGMLTILEQIHRVVLIFAYIGMPLALVKFISELAVSSGAEIKKYVTSAMAIVAMVAGVFCIVYASLGREIAAFYQAPGLRELVLFSAVTTFVYALYETGGSILRGYHRIKVFSTLNVIRWLIIVPVNIILIRWFALLGAVLAIMICSFINLLLLAVVLRRGKGHHEVPLQTPSFSPKVIRRLLGYGLPAMISDSLMIFPMWLALSYLSKQTDFVNVGFYRVAFSLTMIVMFIPMAIAVPIIPLFSELEKKDVSRMEKFFRQSVRLTAILIIPVTAGIALFSKILIPLLYGSGYFPAWHILFFFSAGLYFYSLTSIIGYLIAGTGKMWQGSLLNFVWAVSFIGFSLFFINRYGLVGLGIAYLLSYVVHTATSFTYLKVSFHIRFLNIKKLLLFGFVVYCITYFLLTNTIIGEPTVFVISAIVLLAVIVSCYKLLSEEDKRSLRTMLEAFPFLKTYLGNGN